MAMHGGRVPWDEPGALQGPARTVVAALADSTVRARLPDLGQEPFPREQQTPAALAAYHRAETDKTEIHCAFSTWAMSHRHPEVRAA